jgi:hypothetical protein
VGKSGKERKVEEIHPDAFTIKALLDILLKRRVKWTRAKRIGQIQIKCPNILLTTLCI